MLLVRIPRPPYVFAIAPTSTRHNPLVGITLLMPISALTAQQLQVVRERLLRAGVAWRPPTQVRRPLTNCEVESLDKRRVQCRRVLGVIEGFIESPRSSNQRSSFDLHDTLIPARLENLAIETSWSKDASYDPLVEIESLGAIRGTPRKSIRFETSRKRARVFR